MARLSPMLSRLLAALNQERGAAFSRPGPLWRPVLAVWALLMALLFAVFRRDLPTLNVADPDDALRLVQVRDLLAGQGWFDLHQYRIMAPEGVLMHWSRLVDLPLALVMAALRPLIGQHGAELAAMVAIPALTLLCAVALVMRLADRLFDRDTAITAGIVAGLSGTMVHQMQPLRIDHHGWQIVAALAAMTALHGRAGWRSRAALGLALAAALTISLEGLPLAVLFVGAVGLDALLSRRWDGLAATVSALALGTAGLFLLLRGGADLAQHCDAVSPMHLAALGWAAACCAVLAWWNPRQPVFALAVLAVAGAGAGALIAVAAPQCAGGAFGDIDPFVKAHWLANVREGMPIWTGTVLNAVILVAAAPVGLLGCWHLWRRSSGAQARTWLGHGLVLLGAIAVGALVSRAMTTAAALAIVPAAWQLRRWRLVAIAQTSPLRRMGLNLLLIVAVLPALPVAMANTAWSHRPGAQPQKPPSELTRCDFATGLGTLAALPPTDVFTPIDIGPQILMRTHQRVVATGHHRAQAAIADVMHAFLAPPDVAEGYVRKRHATLLAVCTAAPELDIYRHDAPQGLAAALVAGKPVAWLRPLSNDPRSHIAVWQVMPR